MNNFYLYAAGKNAVSLIQYFGTESIEAIIDSDSERWGTQYFGLPVISLNEARRNHPEYSILVTTYIYESICQIEKSLQSAQVTNYFLSPWIDRFYCNTADLIERLQLERYGKIEIAEGDNPFLAATVEELTKQRETENNRYECNENGCARLVLPNDMIREMARNGYNLSDSLKSQQNDGEINPLLEYLKRFVFMNNDLRKFRNIHKGKRCFLIGNGPSLRMSDLGCLKEHGEVCFGVNKIYFAFENTEWRPDYYIVVDREVAAHALQAMKDAKAVKFTTFYDALRGTDIESRYNMYLRLLQPADHPEFSFDLVEGMYNGYTVIYEAIQLAAYMGFSDIYLLGVDMTSGVRASDPNYHFYKGADPVSNVYVDSATGQARKLIGFAGQELEKRGQHLYNATRGGELEELPRVDFDSLFTE